jgi:hypothetical protein
VTAQANGANSTPHTASASADYAVKTALDCDILTVVRDAHAHEEAARARLHARNEPLYALYKPLGNRDVACVLNAANRKT